MKAQLFLIFNGIIAILIWQMNSVDLQAQEISFTNLPSFQDYRVDPYIKVAGQLQDLGHEAAGKQLLKLAQRETNNLSLNWEFRTAVLCRMLFTNKPNSDFERPTFLGGPIFPGGEPPRSDSTDIRKNYVDWQSEPIEIVDGIPFLIFTGYIYEGTWDPYAAESYVRYCLKSCAWSSVHFTQKSATEKREAVKKLIALPKWQMLNKAQEDLNEQVR